MVKFYTPIFIKIHIHYRKYSQNTIINELLNETAMSDEWKTMGGETYDSSKMNDVMKSSYGKMMTDDSDNANGT